MMTVIDTDKKAQAIQICNKLKENGYIYPLKDESLNMGKQYMHIHPILGMSNTEELLNKFNETGFEGFISGREIVLSFTKEIPNLTIDECFNITEQDPLQQTIPQLPQQTAEYLTQIANHKNIEITDSFIEKAGPGVCVDTLWVQCKFNECTRIPKEPRGEETFKIGEEALLSIGLDEDYHDAVFIDRIHPDGHGGYDVDLCPTLLNTNGEIL